MAALIIASAAGTTCYDRGRIRAAGRQYADFGLGTSAAANALRGIQFVGPNAQAVPFNFGVNITPGTGAVGTNCFNCSANLDTNVTNDRRTRCRITTSICSTTPATSSPTDITASVMLNYGWNAENNQANNGRQATHTIQVDNAFIPDAVRQQMIAQGIPSFSLGTAAIENLTNHRDVSMFNLSKSIAQNYVQNYRQLMRGVFTLTGAYQSVRRGLVVERLCPEQLGARAPTQPLQHL